MGASSNQPTTDQPKIDNQQSSPQKEKHTGSFNNQPITHQQQTINQPTLAVVSARRCDQPPDVAQGRLPESAVRQPINKPNNQQLTEPTNKCRCFSVRLQPTAGGCPRACPCVRCWAVGPAREAGTSWSRRRRTWQEHPRVRILIHSEYPSEEGGLLEHIRRGRILQEHLRLGDTRCTIYKDASTVLRKSWCVICC